MVQFGPWEYGTHPSYAHRTIAGKEVFYRPCVDPSISEYRGLIIVMQDDNGVWYCTAPMDAPDFYNAEPFLTLFQVDLWIDENKECVLERIFEFPQNYV